MLKYNYIFHCENIRTRLWVRFPTTNGSARNCGLSTVDARTGLTNSFTYVLHGCTLITGHWLMYSPPKRPSLFNWFKQHFRVKINETFFYNNDHWTFVRLMTWQIRKNVLQLDSLHSLINQINQFILRFNIVIKL